MKKFVLILFCAVLAFTLTGCYESGNSTPYSEYDLKFEKQSGYESGYSEGYTTGYDDGYYVGYYAHRTASVTTMGTAGKKRFRLCGPTTETLRRSCML